MEVKEWTQEQSELYSLFMRGRDRQVNSLSANEYEDCRIAELAAILQKRDQLWETVWMYLNQSIKLDKFVDVRNIVSPEGINE